MKKSYLSEQIRLMSITAIDLMTQEEYAIYCEIKDLINKQNDPDLKDKQEEFKEQRKKKSEELAVTIKRHQGPREVRLDAVLRLSKFQDGVLPKGIRWWDLRSSKQISEFCGDWSRTMGLEDLSITFDKVILKWKEADILEQIVLYGFYMPILMKDGSVERRHYQMATASAGQLRRNKVQCISDDAIKKTECLNCGMTEEIINAKGGINQNKFLAYSSLPSSATDVWEDFDIDRAIVIDDFEADVTTRMMYISNDYEHIKGVNTTKIKHTDGCGMFLPNAYPFKNVMIRGPYIKGLISPFDFIRFCEVNHARPVINDVWGKEHDLLAEKINVILCASQLKLWMYYDSWDDYKEKFKANNCHLNTLNYEEHAKNSPMNYQFLQTLIDMTDDEVTTLTNPTYKRIVEMACNEEAMLRTLGADEESDQYYKRALAAYPSLLREEFSKESLRSIKKRMTLDAQAGKLMLENRRLYVIPDLYAACEYWFLGIKEPNGLLEEDEVLCKSFITSEEVDLLRSPHLYFEHYIARVNHNPELYEWFPHNGIVTSCKSIVSKICMFDNDGDMLNVTNNKTIIAIVKRMIKKYDIVPLCYNSFKAAPEMLCRETLYQGIIRAHNYSNIGDPSNMLTRLWNKDHPDFEAAADIAFYNNQIIDGAKTAKIIAFSNFPQVEKRIRKAAGSSRSRMPYFFQFTPNGRRPENKKKKKKYLKPTKSTMNRICARFAKMPNMNMKTANVAPFNWRMLLKEEPAEYNITAIRIFCELDQQNAAHIMQSNAVELEDKVEILNYDNIRDLIIHDLAEQNITIEDAHPSVLKYLFTGENAERVAHKQMYWRVFGEIAFRNIEDNLKTCTECEKCKMKIPQWETHECVAQLHGFVKCIDCGKTVIRRGPKQCRCEDCQKIANAIYSKQFHAKRRVGGENSA